MTCIPEASQSSPEDLCASARSWPKLHALPRRRKTIALSVRVTGRRAERLRQGFIPAVQEEHWFAYFEDDVLHVHRSWTGYCAYEVHFVRTPDGLRATQAEVNRFNLQCSNTDDEFDRCEIVRLIDEWSNLPPGAKSPAVDPLVTAIEQALRPRYLGSPQVVHALLQPYVRAVLGHQVALFGGAPSIQAAWGRVQDEERRLTRILAGGDSDYVAMPWHSPGQLGRAAIRYFELNEEYCAGESLQFVVLESLAAVSLGIGRIVRQVVAEESDSWERDALPRIAELARFAETVFLGTNAVFFPEQVIGDFCGN